MAVKHWIRTLGAVAILAVTLAVTHQAPWARETATLGIAGRANATPWVDADGPLVAVAWGAAAGGKTDVFVAVSRDGGGSFGAPVQVNGRGGEARLGGELPPRVAIRRGTGGREITVVWTARGDGISVKRARSLDGGKTFQEAVTLQAAGVPGDRGWPSLALGGDGRAHAIWLDHRGLADRDRGRSGAGHASGTHDGVAMAAKSALYYADAAAAAPREVRIANGVCYCCKTALAAGAGGRVFAAWRHVYPGNLRDIAFSVSSDGGRTFAPPARVSEDGWEIDGCPDDGPAMAVDARGTVHLVWPTVINPSNPEGALFYATTRDGRAFSPRVRVPALGSLKPTHPQIVADARGRVVVAWDELVKGRRVVGLREVRRGNAGGVEFGPIATLSTSEAASYPVLAATSSGILAVWTSGGSDTATIGVRRIALP